MEIKVVRVPGRTEIVELNSGATVADALAAAGTSVSSGESLKINATPADHSDVLSEGDKVIISKGAKNA